MKSARTSNLFLVTSLAACVSVGLWLAPSPANAQVSTPFTGVTLVRHGGRVMAIADLCAAGVTLRATKYGERGRTPESWANLPGVGAAVAVNADFFDLPGATRVNGRARGGGESWPADKQMYEYTALGEVRSYWQFGPGLAAHVAPSTTAPAPGATELVGAHNVIIRAGKSLGPAFDGDGVLQTSNRRTGFGVNVARSKVYLFTSNDTLTGAVMAQTMLAYAAEGGAPDLDVATNEDGGGSSQMFVRGQGQIVTSGRLVANHLGIIATGSGPSPMCPNKAPGGVLDGADCEHITGWAQDPDDKRRALDVDLSFDAALGGAGARPLKTGPANVHRPDLCTPLGSCEHAFDVPTPYGLVDGKEHAVFAYGIDASGGPTAQLGRSPKKLTCAPPALNGIKRHITDPATFTAWRFESFADVLVVSEDDLAKVPEGRAISGGPLLVQADDGSPEVWLADGAERHHVPSPAVARAWRLDLGKVVKKPAAEVNALTKGASLRTRPWLVKGSGGRVYLLEALPGQEGGPGGTGGTGRTGGSGASGGTGEADGAAEDGEAGEAGEGCTTATHVRAHAREGAGGGTSRGMLAAVGAMLAMAVAARRRRRTR